MVDGRTTDPKVQSLYPKSKQPTRMSSKSQVPPWKKRLQRIYQLSLNIPMATTQPTLQEENEKNNVGLNHQRKSDYLSKRPQAMIKSKSSEIKEIHQEK